MEIIPIELKYGCPCVYKHPPMCKPPKNLNKHRYTVYAIFRGSFISVSIQGVGGEGVKKNVSSQLQLNLFLSESPS